MKLQVAALFRDEFRLSILAAFLSWERTGANLGQPTSLTSGNVPFFVRRVGAAAPEGGFGFKCGQPPDRTGYAVT
jgi:hypothetical protein